MATRAPAGHRYTLGRFAWPLAVAAVCISVWLPIGLTDRVFFIDWANHLWLVSEQAHSMSRLWRPTYFVHTAQTGFYYPFYALYGGSLYAVTGASALAIGSVPRTYELTYLGGFCACAFGTWWLARGAGIARPLAAAVALIPATSAYSITNAYGRGAWPEFMATSMIPLVVAAFVAVIREPRLRLRDVIALVGAAMVLSGSHTITLELSVVFLIVAAFCVVVAFVGSGLQPPRLSRVGTTVGIAALGVTLNGWFLVPLVAYGRQTQTARTMTSATWEGFMPTNLAFSSPSNVLGILPHVPTLSGTPELYVQAPVPPSALGPGSDRDRSRDAPRGERAHPCEHRVRSPHRHVPRARPLAAALDGRARVDADHAVHVSHRDLRHARDHGGDRMRSAAPSRLRATAPGGSRPSPSSCASTSAGRSGTRGARSDTPPSATACATTGAPRRRSTALPTTAFRGTRTPRRGRRWPCRRPPSWTTASA